MIIRDLSGAALELVTGEIDVEAIDKHFSIHLEERHGYLVSVRDGDYSEVYLFDGEIPSYGKTVKKLL